MPVEVEVIKTGGSLRIRIPSDFAKHLNINEGDTLLCDIQEGDVIYRKTK